MRAAFIILFLSACLNMQAQNREVQIAFVPTYGNEEIKFGEQYYRLPTGDSIVFDVFKAYISAVSLWDDGQEIFQEAESFHLVNSEEDIMQFTLRLHRDATYNTLQFNLGIDSATSTSGALGGDLDPAKGMFWTWQSGYINCKIEGRSNLCPTRHHEFQFHMGGYAVPNNALQQVALKVQPGTVIKIQVPMDKFIGSLNLKKEHSIMSPGPEAVALSKQLANTLRVQQP